MDCVNCLTVFRFKDFQLVSQDIRLARRCLKAFFPALVAIHFADEIIDEAMTALLKCFVLLDLLCLSLRKPHKVLKLMLEGHEVVMINAGREFLVLIGAKVHMPDRICLGPVFLL